MNGMQQLWRGAENAEQSLRWTRKKALDVKNLSAQQIAAVDKSLHSVREMVELLHPRNA